MESIVLNRMFVGEYCATNIGHEIINIFQADNGHYYIYLNATGDFAADKRGLVKYVLLTRNCSMKNTVQIIGKAKVLREVYNPNEKNQRSQINEIHYGGASITDLFSSNTRDQDIYVTYEVESIVEPQNDLYISFDKQSQGGTNRTIFLNDSNQENTIQMARASLKQYIDPDSSPFAYQRLIDAISDVSLWKKQPVGKVIDNNLLADEEDNFFKMCGIQDSELAFSNAFASLARKHPKELCKFAKDVLKIDLSEKFTIHREKWNIDILISDEKNVIVLENKVLSHINGTLFTHSGENEFSQLKKYYDIIMCQENIYNKEHEYKKCASYFFILAPNHNYINKENYIDGDKYTLIAYSQIKDFLDHYQGNAFVKQLLLALSPHCESSYDYFQKMKNCFLLKCNEVKQSQIKTDDAENPQE